VHFLQIWIKPQAPGITPSYEQKYFAPEEKRGKLRLIASADAGDGSVRIHQDARVYAGLLDGNERIALTLDEGRQVYVHVARGSLTANGSPLEGGDALKLRAEKSLILADGKDAEVMVFDLPQ